MSRGFRVWDIEAEEYLPISTNCQDGLLGITADGSRILYLKDGEVTWFKDGKSVIIERDTGLKDKNGERIYGGDIVANGTLTGVVEYKVDDFCAWVVGTTTNGIILLSGSWTVISNIHENPELLEDGK